MSETDERDIIILTPTVVSDDMSLDDCKKFKVKRKMILMSGLVSNMLEEEDDEEDDIPSIPIPNVDAETFEVVHKYIRHHWNNKADEINKPLKGKIEDVISKWDKAFLDTIDKIMLIKLIMASNYLNIGDLLDLTCAYSASNLKGKTPEKIREMFGIECDFEPAEKKKIEEENKWAE